MYSHKNTNQVQKIRIKDSYRLFFQNTKSIYQTNIKKEATQINGLLSCSSQSQSHDQRRVSSARCCSGSTFIANVIAVNAFLNMIFIVRFRNYNLAHRTSITQLLNFRQWRVECWKWPIKKSKEHKIQYTVFRNYFRIQQKCNPLLRQKFLHCWF